MSIWMSKLWPAPLIQHFPVNITLYTYIASSYWILLVQFSIWLFIIIPSTCIIVNVYAPILDCFRFAATFYFYVYLLLNMIPYMKCHNHPLHIVSTTAIDLSISLSPFIVCSSSICRHNSKNDESIEWECLKVVVEMNIWLRRRKDDDHNRMGCFPIMIYLNWTQ